jgi:hypothetical protein
MAEGHPVSIGALQASGIPLRPHEAVAIVAELCSHLAKARAVPVVMPAISASTVTIDASGAVAVTGGAHAEDEQTVSLAGRLLLEMLDHPAGMVGTAPPRLRTTAVRAALAGRSAFATAGAFASALQRHGPEDGRSQAIRALFNRWESRIEGRIPASSVPVLPGVPRNHSSRMRRALVVGAVLIGLAGAGLMLLVRGAAEEPPLVAPASRPTPVLPRREPGRELLRRTERASAGTVSRPVPTRRAAAREPRELTLSPQADLPIPVR